MRIRRFGWIGALLAVTLFFSSATGVCRADRLSIGTMGGISGDTSSDGAVITVVLFATLCVVMVLLGLRTDYQNVFGHVPPDEREEREALFAERMGEILQEAEYQPLLRSTANPSNPQWANSGLGLRLEF